MLHNENHKTWDTDIKKIAQAIRVYKHEITSCFPAFARHVLLSGDYYGKIIIMPTN